MEINGKIIERLPEKSGESANGTWRKQEYILETNNQYPKKTHFCIFDELYSGTNPDEASQAGKAFINYLSRFSNVDFILTTHYFKTCKFFSDGN